MSDLVRAFNESLGLFGWAFAGSVLVALTCAVVGVHVVARRLILVGVALPQMAALGIAISFAYAGVEVQQAGGEWKHQAIALVLVLIGAAILALGGRRRLLGNDAVAGILFVAAGALTILVMMRSARGMDEVKNLVEGNVLTVGESQFYRLCYVLVPVLLLCLVGIRRFLFCTFDRETAATLGVHTGIWEILFYLALALVVAAGVHSTGTLFVFGFLVLPGATGLILGRTSWSVMSIAAASAVFASAAGFVLSDAWDAPTGPMCVGTMFAVLLVSSALAWVLRRFERRTASAVDGGCKPGHEGYVESIPRRA